MNNQRSLAPGLTIRSVPAAILSITLSGALVQFTGVVDLWGANLGTEALGVPAMMVFLIIVVLSGALFAARRWRLLTRTEMLCVVYATLIATPLMSHGFWRTMLGATIAIPRGAIFDRLDALSPKLWPRGEDVLQGILSQPNAPGITYGGSVEWHSVEIGDQQHLVPLLRNVSPDQVSWLRVTLPATHFQRRLPYLLTVLARARDLGPQSRYYCRIYYDGNAEFAEEAFTSRTLEDRNYLQKEGFVRLGKYGVSVPVEVRSEAAFEFGLSGVGTVELHDAQLIDVSAAELAYSGRQMIAEDEYERLPLEERAGLTVRPRNLWSLAGLRFLVVGLFPWRHWVIPSATWGAYVLLLLTALFSIAVIMRRQWIQNERYPLPMAQVPFALLGDESDERHALPAVLRNRFMWAGYAAALVWCLMRLAHAFNSSVPNVDVSVSLKPFFTDARWGATWNDMTFTVSALFLGLGLFMEQNVLISMVVGLFLFRFQYWFGETQGLVTIQDYPFAAQQMFGSYTAYAVLVIVFARRYLWQVLKMAVRGDDGEPEIISYRTALVTLSACVAGIIAWARWAELPVAGTVGFFFYMLSIGFVACKLRAECGAPHANYAAPQSGTSTMILAVVSAFGGMPFFGPRGVIFICIAAMIFGYYFCFFNVSGLQLELIEAGHRLHMRRVHVPMAAALGAVGGIVVGGWFYLSGLYSLGADNYPLKAAYFEKGAGEFTEFNTALARVSGQDPATSGDEQQGTGGRVEAKTLAVLFGAALTAVLTVLRQLFAGFWFHPLGFILGGSRMVHEIWGSLLMAFLVRFVVLRLGGAATVREKLQPFATGVFLASITAYIICFFVNSYVWFFNPGGVQYGRNFF